MSSELFGGACPFNVSYGTGLNCWQNTPRLERFYLQLFSAGLDEDPGKSPMGANTKT
jgi:hypothetical protein